MRQDDRQVLYQKKGRSGKDAGESVLDTVRRVLEDIRGISIS